MSRLSSRQKSLRQRGSDEACAAQIIDATTADRELASVLEQIAEIAGVPPNNRPDLIKFMQGNVAMSRDFAYRVELFGGSDIKKPAKRIADAAAELANAMADEGAVEFIRLQIDNPRPQSLAEYQTMTGRFAEAAKRVAAMKDNKRDPWRLFRTMFREWLVRDVEEAGGKLTLNQTHPERSTLVKALDLLTPFLPREFSKERSFSTLRRFKRGVRNRKNRSKNTRL